jgi:hypothetical protein
VAWWAVAAPVALAATLAALRASPAAPAELHPEPPRLRRLNAVMVVALAAVVVALQPLWRAGDPLAGPPGLLGEAPGDLARALAAAAGRDDKAVVPQPWASWFEWAAPGVPVMVDSRVEVVPVSAWEDYLAIVAGGPEALATLDRIGATVVVVDPATQGALEVALRTIGSGWRLVCDDADGLIFVPEH